MKFTAAQIAETLNGSVEGNAEVWVDNVSKIEEGLEHTLSFLANPKYNDFLYTTQSSIVIINNDFVVDREIKPTLIRVPDAYQGFARLLEIYSTIQLNKTGVEEPHYLGSKSTVGDQVYLGAFSYIGSNCKIGNNVKIYPHVSIGDGVSIGDNTTLFSGVKVYSQSIIGSHCTLHSGVVVGSDGFGFAPNDSTYKKVPQIGNVIIEDHVEIGSNTTIDRATLGSTIIRKGVKLDNLIQVAHNVEIGENTVIAAQTGIAGSTKIGSNCMIGGQVGIVGHVTIANNVKIAAQSGIGQSILDEGAIYQGSPAFAIGDYRKSYVVFRNLPELVKKIDNLEKGF